MSKKGYGKFFLAVLAAAVFVAAGYVIYRVYIKPIQPMPRRQVITLYFYNPDTDTLKPLQRAVPWAADLLDRCRTIVAELGSSSGTELTAPIPTEVMVNSAVLKSNGILNLDLSRNLVRGTPEGSSAEIAALYAIVNSIAKNIYGTKAVQLTIDGKQLKTLETHIEIDEPIVPDYTK